MLALGVPQPCSSAGCMISASDNVYISADESFYFYNNDFNEIPCKLDATENPRQFENVMLMPCQILLFMSTCYTVPPPRVDSV